ncbi:MAG: hypothetical protein GEV28_14740 [Actinophytocola sp.]|uniref:ABC transporter permease n=1 Tax=Actinophytocola sp. TaxID=1872138 RepID=UPI00132C83FE|nr:ABC transporter permease [Actinophytocola sp.]MPZ81581.1 hypothetical protein [Actinophytocola sp.]
MSHVLSDSLTMLRRNARHTRRNPAVLFVALTFPVITLLMFVYVFGGAFAVGTEYVDYVTPGILLMAVTYGVGQLSVSVSHDMNNGIINRFRTMAVSRASVLTGHVLDAMIRTILCLAVVVGVALVVGFRPDATPAGWLLVLAVFALLTLAVSWLSVAFGLIAKTPDAASFSSFPLTPAVPVERVRAAGDDAGGGCAGSPTTSRSCRSSRRSGGCSPARRSAAAGSAFNRAPNQ